MELTKSYEFNINIPPAGFLVSKSFCYIKRIDLLLSILEKTMYG